MSLMNLTRAFRGFVLIGFENSRGHPKNKIRHSGPSVGRTIEIGRQLERVFESNRMVFKESSSSVICQTTGPKRFLHIVRS